VTVRQLRVPLRARLTLAFAAGMAVVLVGVAAFVYVNLRIDLRASIDSGLQSRAQVITANVSRSDAALGGSRRHHLIDADEAFAQVLLPSGRIVEATRAVARRPLVSAVRLATIDSPTFVDYRPPRLDASRLLIVPVRDAGRAEFVVVGATLSDSQEALHTALVRFAVAAPVALLVSSLTGWLLAGAALRPVERMRREAAAISASDPTHRLLVPRTDDTLARLAVTLNTTFDRLQEALERERRFVDDASHDLRTPLTILKAEVDLAMSGERSAAELRGALASASVEVNHLVRIAEDLLVLARAEHGRIPVRQAPVSLGGLVDGCRRALVPVAEAVGVRIEGDARDTTVELDGTRVRQALHNLLENAIRNSPAGGLVRIRVRDGGSAVTIAVEDSGPGFDPAELEAVFQPFHRGRNASYEGSGLGLAIVRAIAEAHHGSATAANRPEGGARVTLFLATPARPRSPASRPSRRRSSAPPAAGTASLSAASVHRSGTGRLPAGERMKQ
jgi:two-component system, OmpR family, sensor kinase